MVLTCAGMSSGPSVSWVQPASSGPSRSSAVIRSSSTDGSAFSWMVSDAEVWRMNSVSAPSLAETSRTNFATSRVRSTKPAPAVCTVSKDDTIVAAATREGAERDNDSDEVTSNLPGNILLAALGHLDHPPPGLLQERHHAIHVAIARQGDFDLAFGVGLRGGRLERIGLRQRLIDLAGHRRLARRQLRFQLFVVALQPADFRIQCGALVGHGVAGPAGAGIVAGRNRAGAGVEPDHAVGDRRQRIAAVLDVRHLRNSGARSGYTNGPPG